MKICHVAPELLPVPPTKGGAIERWIRDAAVRLVERGHEVHVISRDHGDGARRITIDGVQYHYVRIPESIDRGLAAAAIRGLWYYMDAARSIGAIAPDVVHHHSRPAGLWLTGHDAAAAPQVISLHSMQYGWGFGYRGWDRLLYQRGLAAAARVLGVSDFICAHAVERYPAMAKTTRRIYNGVDGRSFKPGMASPATAPQTILYVGRVEQRKGVHVLLDAFEHWIAARAPHARLRIVGPHSYWDRHPSPYYAELKARCEANPRIELRGPTYVDAELAQVYRDAAVSVVPSVFPEALGLTSIEAQASGVPVVVSNAGGLPETVSDGHSGIVFENGNAEQLAQAVLGLLMDEPRRRAMAEAARDWAMQIFSWDVIVQQLEDVYEEVLKDKPKGLSAQSLQT